MSVKHRLWLTFLTFAALCCYGMLFESAFAGDLSPELKRQLAGPVSVPPPTAEPDPGFRSNGIQNTNQPPPASPEPIYENPDSFESSSEED